MQYVKTVVGILRTSENTSKLFKLRKTSEISRYNKCKYLHL